jgi:hypothetical protein
MVGKCVEKLTQLKAQGPSRTCNESKEEEKEIDFWVGRREGGGGRLGREEEVELLLGCWQRRPLEITFGWQLLNQVPFEFETAYVSDNLRGIGEAP